MKWAIPIALAATLATGCGKADEGTPATPAAAATSAAPAGNGVADLAPDEILKKAKTAVEAAKSYRIKGEMVDEGETITIDLAISGKDVQGEISMGKAAGTVELLAVGGQQYIRPDEKFWAAALGATQAKTFGQLMGDKWAKISAKDQDMAALFGIADGLLDASGGVTKGQTKQVNGVDAIGLIDGGEDGGTLWIATTGEPYPLLVEGPPSSQGQLTLSDFGKALDIKAPAAAEIVDFDQLTGGK